MQGLPRSGSGRSGPLFEGGAEGRGRRVVLAICQGGFRRMLAFDRIRGRGVKIHMWEVHLTVSRIAMLLDDHEPQIIYVNLQICDEHPHFTKYYN